MSDPTSNQNTEEATTTVDNQNGQRAHVKKYDFRQPKLVSKEIMRALHKIHNLFAGNVQRIFSNVLNLKVEVTLDEVEQVIFAQFLSTIEQPTALFLFNIEELGEWATLQMDPSFCMFFVEHQSGGRSLKLGEARTLTRIEERVMGRTLKKIFKELTHTWSSYVKMTILHHVYESKPANIRTISSHIPGIAVTFMLEVEKMKVPIRLCYPYALLKEQMMSSFGELNQNSTKASLSSSERLQFKKEMKNVDVLAKVMLGKTNIPVQRLIRLQEGDVIKLDQRIDEPLTININDRHKMTGYPGVKAGKKAVKVFEILKNDHQ